MSRARLTWALGFTTKGLIAMTDYERCSLILLSSINSGLADLLHLSLLNSNDAVTTLCTKDITHAIATMKHLAYIGDGAKTALVEKPNKPHSVPPTP